MSVSVPQIVDAMWRHGVYGLEALCTYRFGPSSRGADHTGWTAHMDGTNLAGRPERVLIKDDEGRLRLSMPRFIYDMLLAHIERERTPKCNACDPLNPGDVGEPHTC